MTKGSVLLCAGGTGGHLFPAEALAHELVARGYSVHLATDMRAKKYAAAFPADGVHVIRSATVGGKNPVALAKTIFSLGLGYQQSSRLVRKIRPVAAVGFGGYPTLPPIFAASNANVPCLLHEQNAILGRANWFLAKRAKGIAIGFALAGERPEGTPVIETGNPVRPMVKAVMDTPYPSRTAGERFRLVVFGGSQGARFFSEIMPEALAMLGAEERSRISLLEQAREEDQAALNASLQRLGIEAQVSPFFKDMPAEIAGAHFVIARAGASSVGELAVIGRPSLLVPLPGSLDGDQAANAASMEKAGGAIVVRQAELSAERLAGLLREMMNEPARAASMAAAARSTGKPDAAEKLADCVECVISGGDLASAAT
ncbi:MAG: undecaprenyldiphospho-muramoylpentapeptide beta-N-acetylglucosaminyltransferase [Nitratireductor sp.]|nr:undecaprenyldiphospho-muramoylpentapeptide beta-N-acetylglucosaminyltransferase [Nitratireductor sp.]MCC0022330.1 undecaprenyldiphospho-muramoylpentapeptide beta-N-acetylglucosaminyltransferase [Nitratireductor sp.]